MNDYANHQDDDRDRKVERYIIILRQLGFIAACTFSLSFILGVYVGRIDQTLTLFVILAGFFIVYIVVDRLSKAMLGPLYRPDDDPMPHSLKSFLDYLGFWVGLLFFFGLLGLAVMARG